MINFIDFDRISLILKRGNTMRVIVNFIYLLKNIFISFINSIYNLFNILKQDKKSGKEKIMPTDKNGTKPEKSVSIVIDNKPQSDGILSLKNIIQDIENYMKNNYVDNDDKEELKSLVKYAKEIIKTGNNYSIAKTKDLLELNFFKIKKRKSEPKIVGTDIKDKKISNQDTKINNFINSNHSNISTLKTDNEKKERKSIKVNEKKLIKFYKDSKENSFKIREKRNNFKYYVQKVKTNKEQAKEFKISKEKSNNFKRYLQKDKFNKKIFSVNKEKSHTFISIFAANVIANKVKNNSNLFNKKDKNNIIKKNNKAKISFLIKSFKKIYIMSLTMISNVERNVAIAFKILLLKNKLLFGNSLKNDIRGKYNNAIFNKENYNNLINDAINSLDSISMYIENNCPPELKNSKDYRQLLSYIDSLRIDLKNNIEETKEKSNIKILKKVE